MSCDNIWKNHDTIIIFIRESVDYNNVVCHEHSAIFVLDYVGTGLHFTENTVHNKLAEVINKYVAFVRCKCALLSYNIMFM